jgi:hypothetical protein
MNTAQLFLSGMLSMGYLVAAVFFLRFWSRSRDRLFLYFAGAFALLSVQRISLVVATDWLEDTAWIFLIRLAAFVLILFAIVSKNRKRV